MMVSPALLLALHLALPRHALAVAATRRLVAENRMRSSDPLPRGRHGEAPWPLYSASSTPGTQVASIPQETYARAETHHLDGQSCFPQSRPAVRDSYDVVAPSLIPFIRRKEYRRSNAVVVIVPAGRDRQLAMDVTGFDLAEWLNGFGISALVLKYRVPAAAWAEGETVGQMDVQRAVSLARHRAVEFGLDPSKVGVLGSSGGGKFAIRATLAPERAYSRLDAADDVSYKPDYMLLLYPEIDQAYMELTGSAPSTFIAMAVDDPCAPATQTLGYYHSLRRHQAPASELHIYPSGGHGFGQCSSKFQEVCGWTSKAEAYLHSVLTIVGGRSHHHQFSEQQPAAQWCPPSPGRNTTGFCAFSSQKCVGHCDVRCWKQCI